MLIELLFTIGWMVAGLLALHAAGLRGWGLFPLGFLSGATGFVAISALLLMTGIPRLPVVALALLLSAAVSAWYATATPEDRGSLWHPLVVAVPLTVVLVLVFRGARLVNYHFDSLELAAISAMTATGQLTYSSTAFVQFRAIGFPLLHAPAALSGALYLESVGPLLALGVFGAFVWYAVESAPSGSADRRTWLVALLGLALLATNNRVVFHSFYLHTHMLTAAAMLVFVASGWMLALRSESLSRPALRLLQLVVLPALVITRSESVVVAALAMAPTLLSSSIERRHRIAVASVYAAAAITPQLFFIVEGYRVAGAPHGNTLALLAIGLIASAGGGFIAMLPIDARREQRGIKIAYTTVLLGVVGLATVAPGIVRTSAVAAWGNFVLGVTGWGVSAIVLAVLVALVLTTSRQPLRHHLALPILTFVPAAFAFAIARDGSYRVHPADSLNRMLLHVVPLAVLLVVSSIIALAAEAELPATGHRDAQNPSSHRS